MFTTKASVMDALLAPPLDGSKLTALCGALEDFLGDRLYVRACFEQTMDWTRKLGSQRVHDVQGTYTRAAQEVELY